MLVSVFEGQADIPWRNKEEKNTIEEHGNLWRMPAQYEAEQMQAAGDMIKVLHSQCGRSPDQVPPLEHLLIFTASIVPAAQVAAGELKVLFTRSREDGAVETHATLEVTSELCKLLMGGMLEFVCFTEGLTPSTSVFLLLVEWKAGVAYRVCPDMLFYVDQCKWEEVTKAWKLIILA